MSQRIKEAEAALKLDPENYALWLDRGMGLIYDPVDEQDKFVTDDERTELYLIDELYALGNYYYLHVDIQKSNQLLLRPENVRTTGSALHIL